MKSTDEGRGLSKVRGRTGLEVRGGHRCGWGWVGGKFRLGGVRGWQFWGRDEQARALEVRWCWKLGAAGCRWLLVAVVRRCCSQPKLMQATQSRDRS